MTTGRKKLQRSGFKDSQHGSDVAVTSCQEANIKAGLGGREKEKVLSFLMKYSA